MVGVRRFPGSETLAAQLGRAVVDQLRALYVTIRPSAEAFSLALQRGIIVPEG